MRERAALSLSTLVLVALAIGSCNSKSSESSSATGSSAAATSAPAATASPASTSATATTPTSTAPPTASSPSGPAASASEALAESTARLNGAAWALRQDAIKSDPDGQWAVSATASTSYNNAQGTADWSAMQAAGAPNVTKYGDDAKAWAPSTQDAGIEWLDLKYTKPVHATAVRVRESCGSGAVIKVELYDPTGTARTIWEGLDPTKELNYLELSFPATAYLTNRVKVTLATNTIPGWNEIDAVQLVGKAP
jgi:hypothetical protein